MSRKSIIVDEDGKRAENRNIDDIKATFYLKKMIKINKLLDDVFVERIQLMPDSDLKELCIFSLIRLSTKLNRKVEIINKGK